MINIAQNTYLYQNSITISGCNALILNGKVVFVTQTMIDGDFLCEVNMLIDSSCFLGKTTFYFVAPLTNKSVNYETYLFNYSYNSILSKTFFC
mgnify:CR=1 FL=1